MTSLSPVDGAAIYLLYGFVSLVTLILGYRLFLHPLRNYPGPLLAKITNCYTGLFAFKRDLHLEIWRNHQNYGPVVRVAPDRIAFNSATALRDIYQNDRVTKPPLYLITQAKPGVHNTWNALDRDLHRRKRKVVARAVTDASMRAFEPDMIEQVDIFIQQLARGHRQPINMKEKCSYLSFEIAALLSFGYALNLQTNEENQFLIEQLNRTNHRMNIYMQMPIIHRYKLQVYINMLFKKERERTSRLIERMVRTRMKQDKHAKRDVYSFLADSLDTKEDGGIRLSDLWYEALFFIIAGGDTSATAMSATFFYLSRNPKSYQKLAAEIRTTFQSADEIRGSKLAGCHYLRACIDESLRMSPPAPGTLWRHLAPEEDGKLFVVDGNVIPKGTKVGVNTYSLHHNEEYFKDPFAYNPDRWIDAGESERKAMYDAFCPFSVGSRGCAGKATAYLELSLAVAKALWYFDFETAPGKLGDIGLGQRGEFRLYDIFTSSHDGPFLVFKPRDTFTADFGTDSV